MLTLVLLSSFARPISCVSDNLPMFAVAIQAIPLILARNFEALIAADLSAEAILRTHQCVDLERRNQRPKHLVMSPADRVRILSLEERRLDGMTEML
jgi:hypothetical protein